ncbi:MAG: DUF378 domain-containing protein [Candidatus Yonathbacteria bacterium]|nr:DUF378 domain-containing protein [Candidatus Yonathbacteria bacterium]
MKILHIIALILLVIGGLNWGLTAFNYNVVEMILGISSTATRAVYVLVALSAIYLAISHKGDCKTCEVSVGQ